MANMPTDTNLLVNAESLRSEALQLLEHNGLLSCFTETQAVEVVGSVAMNLMTRRDIDIACCLDPLEINNYILIGEKFSKLLSIGRMTFIDPGVVPWHEYKTGLFCGIEARSSYNAIWNIDIWAYGYNDFAEAMRQHQNLASRIGKIDRTVVLRLKSSCDCQSYLVYKAIIEHGVRTIAELNKCLKSINK